MSADLRIRAMRPGDIPAVAALAAELPTASHWPQDTYELALDPINLPERIALVAEAADSTPAGFAIASILGAESELESIAIACRFQRQGVARGLLMQLTARLARRNIQTLFLEVRASNEAALELYRAVGFAESGRRRGYYGDPVEDALVLRMQLSV